MRFEEYAEQAVTTALPSALSFDYLTTALVGEVGELSSIFAKAIRDNNFELTEDDRLNALKEIGDVLWYLALLSVLYGSPRLNLSLSKDLRPQATAEDDVISALLILFNEASSLLTDLVIKSESPKLNESGVSTEIINNLIDTLSFLASFLGSDIEFVAALNLSKLKSRKERNQIGGSGDNR